MEQAEEERRQKEERNFQQLLETVALDDAYFASRDMQNKGRDVHPSAKQRKQVQDEAAKIRFISKRKQGAPIEEALDNEEIDLKAKPRVFVTSGCVNKYEPDNIIRKFNRRYMIVFNDVILVANKKDTNDFFEVTETYWVKDLRIKYSKVAIGEFELQVNRGRNRARSSVVFTCDSESAWRQMVEDVENTVLAYHRQTETAKTLGWFHDIVQGNLYSAAYLGDIIELRRHVKLLLDDKPALKGSYASITENALNEADLTGMTALHWAALRGHEVCVRLLLDKGAEVDALQKGMNSPLLLAAAGGHETVARLLLERGADITLRNVKGHDAVFMAVLYGHATKGLPWLLQLLTHRGIDLNQVDSCGATPLHLCAEKNLARPVRMLVDAGADVNAKYGQHQWSPLQLACKHRTPDVETIRSFLDKGAYPNWRDLNGKTAFDIALSMQPTATGMLARALSEKKLTNSSNNNTNNHNSDSTDDGTPATPQRGQSEDYGNNNNSNSNMNSPDKWRAMDETLSQVGDWAVRALPALLELCRKGARFDTRDIDFLRPSFRSAVLEARDVWLAKVSPSNFREFVIAREQAGEELLLHKGVWHKDKASSNCPLCFDSFGLTNRRHHCRACGVLCCDKCSPKRMQLSYTADVAGEISPAANNNSSNNNNNSKDERVCDGCFNRLSHEASQPSPDHFRVRQLKQCALDAIQSIEELIEALDDPYGGDSAAFQSSVKETQQLTRDLGSKMSFSSTMTSNTNTTTTSSSLSLRGTLLSSPSFRTSGRRPSLLTTDATSWTTTQNQQTNISSLTATPTASINANMTRSGDMLIDALKLREAKLYRAEDVIAKFNEAADGYHRVSKKLIEQKTESRRLWGSAS